MRDGRVLRQCRTVLFALAKKSPIRPGPKRKGYQQDALFAANEFVPSEQREPRELSFLWASRKKSSLPNRRTRQNQLIRTNHSRRTRLVSTPVRNLSVTLRPPCLCALCVKSVWRRHFSPSLLRRKRRDQLSSALSALAQKRVRNSRRISTSIFKGLESTLTKTTIRSGWLVPSDEPERRELFPMRFSRQTRSSRANNVSRGVSL